jgi:hypothetical protein
MNSGLTTAPGRRTGGRLHSYRGRRIFWIELINLRYDFHPEK